MSWEERYTGNMSRGGAGVSKRIFYVRGDYNREVDRALKQKEASLMNSISDQLWQAVVNQYSVLHAVKIGLLVLKGNVAELIDNGKEHNDNAVLGMIGHYLPLCNGVLGAYGIEPITAEEFTEFVKNGESGGTINL